MATERLFVYGSMSEGMVHFSRIQNFISHMEVAAIRASAYRLKVGYPVILEEGEDHVPGQLLTVDAPDLLFNLLDEFHGISTQDAKQSLHYKKEVVAFKADEEISAKVYFLNPNKLPIDAQRIPNGDWVNSLKENPALTGQLTEKQISYIQKLGKATGRDIIPINDMALYRELMKLELIVDKGRRLALSRLGQEVYRYL